MKLTIPSCFKAYDIRGKVPDELDFEMSRKIGRGLVHLFGVKKVVIGCDVRPSGKEICSSLVEGLLESGCDVEDIGLCGTEEIYHGVFSQEQNGVDGGIMVTASHNPSDYNGLKIVMKGARPLLGDGGLTDLGRYVVDTPPFSPASVRGNYKTKSYRKEYIQHLLSYIGNDLVPLKIVVNSGNGSAGPVIDELEKELPFHFIKMHHNPDGTFPNGVPNPLLQENRDETTKKVVEEGADLGLGWDGDFDRCFFWDENGRFVDGYYIVGLIAEELLRSNPGEKIIHDPRLIWNTIELVEAGGGTPVMTRTGHAIIKEKMREVNGLYGGEMSAHHYFREFGYCDSGMIPWLLVTSLLSKKQKPLSSLVDSMMAAYPISGEINSVVKDSDTVIEKIEKLYHHGKKDHIDGLSVSFDEYRFNIRKSNTEPLLRLNVETRGDEKLMRQVTSDLLKIIRE